MSTPPVSRIVILLRRGAGQTAVARRSDQLSARCAGQCSASQAHPDGLRSSLEDRPDLLRPPLLDLPAEQRHLRLERAVVDEHRATRRRGHPRRHGPVAVTGLPPPRTTRCCPPAAAGRGGLPGLHLAGPRAVRPTSALRRRGRRSGAERRVATVKAPSGAPLTSTCSTAAPLAATCARRTRRRPSWRRRSATGRRSGAGSRVHGDLLVDGTGSRPVGLAPRGGPASAARDLGYPVVSTLSDLIDTRRAALDAADASGCTCSVGDWQVISDLAFADLVLWLPTPPTTSWRSRSAAVEHGRDRALRGHRRASRAARASSRPQPSPR